MHYQPKLVLLQPYVKHINQLQTSSNNISSMTTVPSGNVYIVVFSGNSMQINCPSSTNYLGAGVYFSGQHTMMRHYTFEGDPNNTILVEMAPDAFKRIFCFDQQQLSGKILSVEDILGSHVNPAIERMLYEKDGNIKQRLIENFLIYSMMNTTSKNYFSLSGAIRFIKKNNGDIRISTLAKEMNLSNRNLERKFIEHIGVSPKTFCKIIQFSQAFKKLMISKNKIMDVFSECGYYDQAHFVNHFKKVMGITLSEFFKPQNITSYKICSNDYVPSTDINCVNDFF